MDKVKLLTKLENDLSHFLISELCKNDPIKRGSSEMYRFKGLAITVNDKDKTQEKTVSIRIGALEAQFKIENGDKVFGGLFPEDERLVQIWINKVENASQLKNIFTGGLEAKKKFTPIVPFDLEDVYIKG